MHYTSRQVIGRCRVGELAANGSVGNELPQAKATQVLPDLLGRTSGRGIGDGPGCFLPGAKLCYLQDRN